MLFCSQKQSLIVIGVLQVGRTSIEIFTFCSMFLAVATLGLSLLHPPFYQIPTWVSELIPSTPNTEPSEGTATERERERVHHLTSPVAVYV